MTTVIRWEKYVQLEKRKLFYKFNELQSTLYIIYCVKYDK